jgi:hypothetical protein
MAKENGEEKKEVCLMICISIGEYISLIHSPSYFISIFVFTGSEPKRKKKFLYKVNSRKTVINSLIKSDFIDWKKSVHLVFQTNHISENEFDKKILLCWIFAMIYMKYNRLK